MGADAIIAQILTDKSKLFLNGSGSDREHQRITRYAVAQAIVFHILIDDKPLLRMLIETYALTFNLFCYEDEPVEPGFIVHGQVWLNGELRKACKEESGETG